MSIDINKTQNVQATENWKSVNMYVKCIRHCDKIKTASSFCRHNREAWIHALIWTATFFTWVICVLNCRNCTSRVLVMNLPNTDWLLHSRPFWGAVDSSYFKFNINTMVICFWFYSSVLCFASGVTIRLVFAWNVFVLNISFVIPLSLLKSK